MKTLKYPVTVTERGVSAKIRRVTKSKQGRRYDSYIVEYFLLGRRKQVWRSDLSQAKATAQEACIKISNGEHLALELRNGDRMAYLRASEAVNEIKCSVDMACRDYADAIKLLAGRASVAEACRAWIKQNDTQLPTITVQDAVDALKTQAKADGKSEARQHQLQIILDRFAESFICDIHTITPMLISEYLSALPLSERTKRNHRDVIGFFNRFCVLRNYLNKDASWLEGVQNYTARKLGEIEIYSPEELQTLLDHADERLIPFLAIGAFAGLRHAEIARLDWSEVELSEQPEESFIEVKADKAKTETRRLVPIKDNLKTWLLPYRKETGPVCLFANTTKQLSRLAIDAKTVWKHNGLRHSCISYRVAECGDVPRVSEESGNSVQVIRTNYLRRVKPTQATEWFSIVPIK